MIVITRKERNIRKVFKKSWKHSRTRKTRLTKYFVVISSNNQKNKDEWDKSSRYLASGRKKSDIKVSKYRIILEPIVETFSGSKKIETNSVDWSNSTWFEFRAGHSYLTFIWLLESQVLWLYSRTLFSFSSI